MKMYSFIDFETTGLNPDEDQIIEVGIIKTINFEKTEILNFFVKLEKKNYLPEIIIELTGITENDLISGKSLEESYKLIKEFISNTIIVAHNVPFDLSFMQDDITINDFYCTLSMSKVLYPDLKHGLSNMISELNLKCSNTFHRALNDAFSTMSLFKYFNSEICDIEYYKNKIVYREDRPFKYVPPNAKMLLQEIK